MRKNRKLAVVSFTVLLITIAALALAQQTSQKPTAKLLFNTTPGTPPAEKLVSGEDIGFRVSSYKNGVPVGRLVIKVDGKWIEPLESVSVIPAR
jgi:hypothetical protein